MNDLRDDVKFGPVFSYDGMPVGLLETYPMADGNYAYKPFRGPGHYEMHSALDRGIIPRCSYVTDGAPVFFDVVACPEYGVLSLARF
jgi:hypothetical protein